MKLKKNKKMCVLTYVSSYRNENKLCFFSMIFEKIAIANIYFEFIVNRQMFLLFPNCFKKHIHRIEHLAANKT